MTIPNPAYLDQNEPTSPTAWEVIVVGAGPSGMTTAAALARAGIRTLLIEKHPGLSIFPKATGLRPRTMEILRSWGLEPTVLAQSQPTQLAMASRPCCRPPAPRSRWDCPSPRTCGSSVRHRWRSARRTDSRRSCSITSSSAAAKSDSPLPCPPELTVDDAGVTAVITSRTDRPGRGDPRPPLCRRCRRCTQHRAEDPSASPRTTAWAPRAIIWPRCSGPTCRRSSRGCPRVGRDRGAAGLEGMFVPTGKP